MLLQQSHDCGTTVCMWSCDHSVYVHSCHVIGDCGNVTTVCVYVHSCHVIGDCGTVCMCTADRFVAKVLVFLQL